MREIPGSSAKVVGPPLKLVATVPLAEHTNENQEEVTLTGSLNVTERFELIGKSVAPFIGKVPATSGAASATAQGFNGDDVLRGVGALAAKSEALLSVSVQP